MLVMTLLIFADLHHSILLERNDMSNIPNMYESNCAEFARYTLKHKQVRASTRHNWNKMIDYLGLKDFPYPPVEIDLFNMVSDKYPNPRTKRGVLQVLNCLLHTKMKTGKPSHPVFDLPDFEELDSYIQTPKNQYQKRVQMYANLMLHGGLRIGETMYKHKIVKNGILVEYQRIVQDNSIQSSKTVGQVLLPDWLLQEYKDWKIDCPTHRTLREWFNIYFHSEVGIPFPNLSPHKLRHMYASYYATKLPPIVLQKQLRHSKIETTMSYYVHIDEGYVLDVLNANRRHLRAISN